MAKLGRDDFSRPTIDTLAKRAGYLCSNPECRRLTIGANEEPNKSTSIGIAAHITAAAEGGPRYNMELDIDERSDISNGIWLCSNCATLIDKDPKKYTVAILYQWKGGIEAESRMKLSGAYNKTLVVEEAVAKNEPIISESIPQPQAQIKTSVQYNPILEVDLAGQGRSRFNKGYSMKNPTEMHDGQLVMVPGNEPIIYWGLSWRYNLVIYNNSNYAAYNVKIENVSEIVFSEFEQLARINNIPPLGNRDLGLRYEDWIEGVYYEADAMLATRYPENFNGKLVFRLTYYDEARGEHVSFVEFKDGEIINRKG